MTHIKTNSMDAFHRGRSSRSSYEQSVIDWEQRGTAIDFSHVTNWKQEEL